VLARFFEASGFSTLLVTMMPYWAEKIGVPRTLAVEHPFGYTLGHSQDVQMQMRLIHQTLHVWETTKSPGMILHATETWDIDPKQAMRDWQPSEPSPIIQYLTPRLRQIYRQSRQMQKRESRLK